MRFIYFMFFVSFLFGSDTRVLESKIYIDKQKQYDIDTIYDHKYIFETYNYPNTTLGFNDDTIWLYFKVHNTTDKEQENVIDFLYRLHDYIHFLEYKDGKLVDHYLTGDLTPHSSRKIDGNDLVFPYTLAPLEIKEFIFKIDSKSNLSIGLRFLEKEDYYRKAININTVMAIYYGAIFIMLIYNSFLYFIIKERVYIYYVLFHLFFALALFTSNGYSFTLLWPNTPEINSYFMPIVFIFANFFSVLFTIHFLELQKLNRYLLYYFYAILGVDIVLFFGLFFKGYLILELMLSFSLISVLSLYVVGLYILIRYKTTPAKFFVLAWSFILFGSIIEELQGLGFIPMGGILSYSSQIGAFMELTLLSLALAHRYNTLVHQLLIAQNELQSLNNSLQEKVDEQTKSLKLLMKELHHRVKNNFQFILTFLWAQKNILSDKRSKEAIDETSQRIYTISSLHEQLDISSQINLDTKGYLESLINSLSLHDRSIKFIKEIKKVNLEYDLAVSMGLILNELITNSLKYAFNDKTKEPQISIKIYETNDNILVFEYEDNGCGFDEKKIKDNIGLGFELIYGLVDKHGASIYIDSRNRTQVIIKFNL